MPTKLDEYGTVVNDEATYQDIAEKLRTGNAVLIPWTDGHGTQLDILFVWSKLYTMTPRLIQRGIRPTDLFVSIMSWGAFGFEIEKEDTYPGYYAEKLRLSGDTLTEAFAELVNGVKRLL